MTVRDWVKMSQEKGYTVDDASTHMCTKLQLATYHKLVSNIVESVHNSRMDELQMNWTLDTIKKNQLQIRLRDEKNDRILCIDYNLDGAFFIWENFKELKLSVSRFKTKVFQKAISFLNKWDFYVPEKTFNDLKWNRTTEVSNEGKSTMLYTRKIRRHLVELSVTGTQPELTCGLCVDGNKEAPRVFSSGKVATLSFVTHMRRNYGLDLMKSMPDIF